MRTRTTLVPLLGAGLLACGGGSGSSSSSSAPPLAIAPVNTVAIIDLAAHAGKAVAYTVTDGTSDVSSTVVLTLDDPALGTFAGPVFTSAQGLPAGASVATTTVHASAGGHVGSTGLWLGALRKTGAQRDLLFTATTGSFAPQAEILKLETTIKAADVIFLVQTSGSMTSALSNFQAALTATVLPNMVTALPSLHHGVADFVDYPVAPYGAAVSGDYPVRLSQSGTSTLVDTQSAINALTVKGGVDAPSSALPAMHHLLRGEALAWPGGSLPAHVPAAGRFGGADFRAGSAAFVVTISNTGWHDAANSPYAFAAPTMATVKGDFTAAGARFIGVTDIAGFAAETQADDLSDATRSNVPPAAFGGACGAGQCCTGLGGAARAPTGPGGTCRLNFIASAGTALADLSTALQAILIGSQYDVRVVLRNGSGNPSGVDATTFLAAPEALAAGDASNGCPAHSAKDTDADGVADTFVSVVAGTPVCFKFAPKAAIAPVATDRPQLFVAYADVVGMPGSVTLDTRVLLFVVPAR